MSSVFLSCSPLPPRDNTVRYPSDLPETWNPDCRDPVVHAIQVWRLGKDYFKDSPDPPYVLPRDLVHFSGIDLRTDAFLEFPEMQPAVQFSCVRTAMPYEYSLERALKKGSPAVRLQALSVLLKVRAPSSVARQWKTLNELLFSENDGRAKVLLADMKKLFDPRSLDRELKKPPPEYAYDEDEALEWSIRATGIVGYRGALPRLKEFSRSENLHTSLAAERSLEDFHGPEGDEALIYCLLGWQYDAYVRAGRALLKRDKALLNRVLSSVTAPQKYRHQQGLFLAECDNPAAVPLLCETVREIGIIDRKMFQEITRLATPEHRPLLEALPGQVRPEQRAQAEQTLQAFLKRM